MPNLSEEISFSIKKELFNSKQQGLTAKTGERVNRKEKWCKISLYSHIPYISKMNSNKRCQERYMLILHPFRKRDFQKKVAQIFVDMHIQQQE
jgi:hypothetical protein